MGDTGMLGLTITLAIVAFLTDSVLLLPVIALPLVVTALSSFIQIISKRLFNKKVFRVAPLHHHFETLGWSRERITMRYWVITGVCAMLGVIIALL
jgi:phospho-N-acetylmuramoyl-pentapeptide-transferase